MIKTGGSYEFADGALILKILTRLPNYIKSLSGLKKVIDALEGEWMMSLQTFKGKIDGKTNEYV